MSRTYCDREHPGDDAEATAWCETYHRPLPHAEAVRSAEGTPAEPEREPVGDVGDLDTCPTCAYPLAASVPWHARLPEGTVCALEPPSAEPAP